jgi:hypothetical protein
MQGTRKDYGEPDLSYKFLDKNFKEHSPARLIYSYLLSSPSKFDKIVNKFMQKFMKKSFLELKNRAKKEAEVIEKENNLDNLIKIMEQRPDPVNHRLLKNKIIKFGKPAIQKIIEKLKNNRNDVFVELAVQIIYESKIDCSSHLLNILDFIKDPYTLSLVCLLLGLIGPKEAIKPVWDYFHILKVKYPNSMDNFEQGPLLALYEFKHRFKIKG